MRLILIGGGGHCRSVIDVIEKEQKYSIRGILDKSFCNSEKVLGYSVLGGDDLIDTYISEDVAFLVTVGQIETSRMRKQLFEMCEKKGAQIGTVISPLAVRGKGSRIGIGTMCMHNSIVNSHAVVGRNCIINTNALVEHDSTVGDHTHISTGAIVNGSCTIGGDCFIGSGAVIINNVSICPGVVVGAGGVVLRDIDAPGVYIGNPVRRVR